MNLRSLAIWLLVVLVSGVVPVTSTCLEDVRGCGDTCARCACKRRPPGEALRAPCACCKPQPGVQPITLLGPAILTDSLSSFVAPQLGELQGGRFGAPPSFDLPVPHPPPRALPVA